MSVPFRRKGDIEIAALAVRRHFAEHGLIAYPTETVYGLGAPLDTRGLDALYALKEREAGKPCILLVSSLEMLRRWGFELGHAAERLARTFWPGPLTLVLPHRDPRLPNGLRGPSGGVAVRWTSHLATAHLIEALDHPLISTSANLAGESPAVSAAEVEASFPAAIASRLLLLLDGGVLEPALPSTVVDCTGAPVILREGAIPRVELHSYLG